eukprot:573103_1
MSYKEVLHSLLSINKKIGTVKYGLDKMCTLQKALHYPDRNFKSIHVTGTNGKGSVCKKIATGLQLAGHRVGLFASPHISSFRERLSVNGELVSEARVYEVLTHVLARAHTCGFDGEQSCSFFEVTAAAALEYFSREHVDYAVIEVGCGGRLDATNIITPILSVITSVSLDHQRILGDTVEEITRQKAGIIKPGVPVIVGPCVDAAITKPIAGKLGSTHTQITGSFKCFDEENAKISEFSLRSILGDRLSAENMRTALRARPPCRMEECWVETPTKRIRVVLDVAHNESAMTGLFNALKLEHPGAKFRTVVGMNAAKSVSACLQIILAESEVVHLVRSGIKESAASVAQLHEAISDMKCDSDKVDTTVEGDIVETINHACASAASTMASDQSTERIVVVCGSCYIMRDARVAVGFEELGDGGDTNEHVSPVAITF